MSFRRRRGLGSEGDSGSGSGSGSGGAPFGGGEDAARYRRWGLGAALFLASAAAGYLVAAEVLFPASPSSAAGDLVAVPGVRGSPLEEARSRLREAGLALRVAGRMPAAGAPGGRVLAQRPLGGQRAAPGGTVSVTVAAPRAERRVPALRSLRGDRARRVLRRMGLAVDTAREPSSVPGGEVVRTEPPAGRLVAAGSTVRVVLSAGPPAVRVPQLTGRHVEDVRGILADSGLALGGVSWDTAAFAAPGRVVSQSPPAGFTLRDGGRVSVRVAGRPTSGGGSGAGRAGRDTAAGGVDP